MSPGPDSPRFGRVVTAMVTPFDDDGVLDLSAAQELARWLASHGSDALVLSGSTGESSVLTDDEKIALWRAVAEAVTIPVIAGSGSNDTAHSIAMTRAATECGVDGVLVVTPYYNRPSQAGISEHFRVVAEAAGDLPVLLYDIPVRSGRRIETATMLRLAREVPNIVGLKDAAGDPPSTAHLAAQAPAGFEIYCGDDVMTLPLARGRSHRSHQRGLALGGSPAPRGHRRLHRPAIWRQRSPAMPSSSTPSSSSPPPSSPTRCPPKRPCVRWACGSGSAACPWGSRPPSWTRRRPRSWPQSGHRP